MWWLATPVVACAAKAVYDAVEKQASIDISEKYKCMDRESKNQLIQTLNKSGLSQHLIAKYLGISASAVSQRLKSQDIPLNKTSLSHINVLIEAKRLGFSNEKLAEMLSSDITKITENEMSAFFKILEASAQQVS